MCEGIELSSIEHHATVPKHLTRSDVQSGLSYNSRLYQAEFLQITCSLLSPVCEYFGCVYMTLHAESLFTLSQGETSLEARKRNIAREHEAGPCVSKHEAWNVHPT